MLVVDGSGGQNRSAVAAVRALAEAGYRAAVTASGRHSLAGSSRFCSRVVPTPRAGEPGFADAVARELGSRRYLTVLPASDAAIMGLSTPGWQLIDKSRLASLAAMAGLRVPNGRRFPTVETLLAAAEELNYPVVVKAAVKTSTRERPARRMERPSDLASLRGSPGPFIVQPFLDGPMHAVCGVMWKGRLVVAVHQRHLRLWPRVCGDACAAVTVDPDRRREEQLERLLAGFDGIFQAEFDGDHLLDLNPRVYGSLELAVSAGANLVGIFCDLLRGVTPAPVSVRPGVGYRWWEGDVRHLLSHWLDGRGSLPHPGWRVGGPAVLRPRFDPGPMVSRLRFAAEPRPVPVTVRSDADAPNHTGGA